jgi:hypothetical protein
MLFLPEDGCYYPSSFQARASQQCDDQSGWDASFLEAVSPDPAFESVRPVAFWVDHSFISHFFQVLILPQVAVVLQFMTNNGNLRVKAKFEARVPAFY